MTGYCVGAYLIPAKCIQVIKFMRLWILKTNGIIQNIIHTPAIVTTTDMSVGFVCRGSEH